MRDNCEICEGRNGGIPGNENIIDGITQCDYCSVVTRRMEMDLCICSHTDGKVLWTLDGIHGVCDIRDGEVVGAFLCSGHFILKPESHKAVRFQVQRWLDEKSERDAKAGECQRITKAWREWEEENGELRTAEPSMGATPDEIAFEGKGILFASVEYGHGETYICKNLESPSWSIVMRAFDMAILITGDKHHCFLEGLEEVPPEEYPEAVKDAGVKHGTKVFRFVTGS